AASDANGDGKEETETYRVRGLPRKAGGRRPDTPRQDCRLSQAERLFDQASSSPALSRRTSSPLSEDGQSGGRKKDSPSGHEGGMGAGEFEGWRVNVHFSGVENEVLYPDGPRALELESRSGFGKVGSRVSPVADW